MDSVTIVASRYGPTETMDRLMNVARARGMTVFARIDHASGAAAAGLALRPTVLLIFGNSEAGTVLMQANPLIGLDLPLRALVWQDEHGKTWITAMNLVKLIRQYDIGIAHTDQVVHSMAESLRAMIRSAGEDQ